MCEENFGENCATCYTDCNVCSVEAPNFVSLHSFANSSSTIVVTWSAMENGADNKYVFVLEMSINQSEFSIVYPKILYNIDNKIK